MAARSKGWRYQNRRGKRVLIIDFYYLDKNGRRQRHRADAAVQTATATAAEARRLMAFAAEHGFVRAEPATSTKATTATIRDFVESTFETDFMPAFKPSTRRRYRDLLKQSLLDEVGHHRLDAFGANEYRAYAATLQKKGIQNKGPLNLVKTILNAAVDAEVIPEAPKLPKLIKQPKKLPKAPRAEDVANQIAASPPWLAVATGLAAYAGLRSGEIRALEARDVDLAERRIHVERAMSDDEVTTTKSDAERWVPIPDPLIPLLAAAKKSKLPQARIVVTTKGRTPTRQNLLNGVRRVQKANNLPRWSVHAFRHFYCSELIRQKVGVEVVRALAGHSSIAITARYLHADTTDIETARKALSGK